MYRPDDNDIDRLSREAAEHYHAPGAPAWDALRQVLDKELPPEKEKKRRGFLFFFLLGLGLAVAGTSTWYGIRHGHAGTSASPQLAEKSIPLKTSAAPVTNNGVEKSSGVEKNNTGTATHANTPVSTNSRSAVGTKTVAATPATENNRKKNTVANGTTFIKASTHAIPANSSTALVHTKTKAIAPNTRSSGSRKASLSSTTGIANNYPLRKHTTASAGQAPHGATMQKTHQQHLTAGDDADLTGSKQNRKGKGHRVADKSAVKNETAVEDANSNGTVEADKENVISKGNLLPPEPASKKVSNPPATASTDTTTAPVAGTVKKDSTAAAATKPKNKSKNEKAIMLGITGGLDLSTVKFTYGSNAGYNIGVMGGYQFNKHWSVYTGIVYTKKNYKLSGSDYHPPKDYWTMYVNLNTVEGYCRMWELPVLARYTFNPQSSTAFFATAGLSSYFMKRQQYEYMYKTGSGMPGSSAWTDDNNMNHIFSILDLSAGFQKPIGRHLNWQVEPYAKIPLGGIGFGDIKLSSFGLNLTIQYKRPLKR